jgi:hypothetical protein
MKDEVHIEKICHRKFLRILENKLKKISKISENDFQKWFSFKKLEDNVNYKEEARITKSEFKINIFLENICNRFIT